MCNHSPNSFYPINAIPLGTCEEAKAGVISMQLKCEECRKNPRPSGDLIPITCSLGMHQRNCGCHCIKLDVYMECPFL